MACPSVEGTSNYIWHTMLPLNHIKIIITGQDCKNQNILAYQETKEKTPERQAHVQSWDLAAGNNLYQD